MSRQPVVSTLTVGFDQTETDGVGDLAGQNRIVLEQMTDRFDSRGQLWASCYASSDVTYITDVGVLTVGETRVRQIRESLKFSNNNSVSLKYPTASNVVISNQFVMVVEVDDEGNRTIIPSTCEFTFDEETSSIVSDKTIYGACIVTYNASYEVLYYKPIVTNIPFGSVTIRIGSIYAYNNYDVQVLDLELDMTSSPDWVEYARVTSKIVLDSQGVWEFPPNWESTYQRNRDKVGDQRESYSEPGRFTGFSYEIDPDNSFVDTRVHCIVEVNSIGSLQYKDHNNGGDDYWAWYAPYFGSSSWNPTYEIAFADPPGGAKADSAEDFKYDQNHRTWRDVFLKVDKSAVTERLQEDYPGASARSNTR